MSIAIEQTIHALLVVLQMVPVGTNLALFQLLWSMLNGSFLASRGAIFPALQANGFAKDEVARSWTALWHGMWRIEEMINAWRQHVQTEGQWQAHEYEGYRPVAADITAFWRFHLKGWAGRYFNGMANRLLGGVGLAIVDDIGAGSSFRFCIRELTTLALVGSIVRQHPDKSGGCLTAQAHWLLGSTPKKRLDAFGRSRPGLIFPMLPFPMSNSGKTVGYHPFTEGDCCSSAAKKPDRPIFACIAGHLSCFDNV